jgi:hypothetical protein
MWMYLNPNPALGVYKPQPRWIEDLLHSTVLIGCG